MRRPWCCVRPAALLLAAVFAACGSPDRDAIQDVLDQAARLSTRTIGEPDLDGLPEPVQRYLRHAGVVGARQLRAVRGRGHAELLFNGSWLTLDTEQYLTPVPLSRNWLARGTLAGVSLSARDCYQDGHGIMSIRLMDDLRFQESSGPEMDRGQLVTALADIGQMPTAWISDSLEWEAVDARSARVALRDRGTTVHALLKFDEHDDLVETYVDGDRFEDVDGESIPRPWSAICRQFQVVGGLRICVQGSAVWHDPDGTAREYGRTWLDEVQFDTFELY